MFPSRLGRDILYSGMAGSLDAPAGVLNIGIMALDNVQVCSDEERVAAISVVGSEI